MAKETVKAKLSNQTDDQAVAVEYDFGDDVHTAIEKFGEDAVFQGFRQQARVNLQNLIRRHIQNGDEPKKVQEEASNWQPGQVQQRRSKLERLQEDVDKMSEEERQELLKQLQTG